MNAFSNENLKDKLKQQFTGLFAPSVTFTYNPGAKTVAFADATTYDTGDFRKSINFTITDKNGKQVNGQLGADNLAGSLTDAVTVSTATLDPSGGYFLQATITTEKRMTGDGHANQTAVAALTGALGSWKLNTHPLQYT